MRKCPARHVNPRQEADDAERRCAALSRPGCALSRESLGHPRSDGPARFHLATESTEPWKHIAPVLQQTRNELNGKVRPIREVADSHMLTTVGAC
jgi:hypothetical protein